MNRKNIKPDTLTEDTVDSTPKLEYMQSHLKEMQAELAIPTRKVYFFHNCRQL